MESIAQFSPPLSSSLWRRAAAGRHIAAALAAGCAGTAGPVDAARELRVMTFNIWVGGEAGGQPLERTAAVIRAAGADIVGLQETLGRGAAGARPDNGRRVAELLGFDYVDQGRGRGIATRFRIAELSQGRFGARVELPEGRGAREAWIFNVHLAHAPYQPYQLLGIPYHDGPFIRTEAEAIRFAEDSRGAEVRALVADMARAAASGAPVFLTGDFNEPSHEDWTPAAAAAGKCPIAVAWPATRAVAAAGLRDGFRAARPDAIGDRGDTWTPTTREDDPRDRHDRIDFVFATGPAAARRAEIAGEKAERADIVVAPYPSDHRGVVVTFGVAGR